MEIQAGGYTVQGLSVGGVYTSLAVRELGVVLDAGLPFRSFAGKKFFFLSHGHADHFGSLVSLLGIRGLMGLDSPTVFMPKAIVEKVEACLEAAEHLQRYDLSIRAVGLEPGDEHQLGDDFFVRAFRTHHPVPALGYQFLKRVQKLQSEFQGLSGPEIARRRQQGEDLFRIEEKLELAYATDTRIRVFETNPSMLKSRVLILECTFLDERKSLEDAHKSGHIHLDELIDHADRFENEAIVLMHFSQAYTPRQVHEILKARCPPDLHARLIPLAPLNEPWFG